MISPSNLFLILLPVVSSHPTETKLLDDLLHNYNTMSRPVKNLSDPVIVRVGLVLQQIIKVEESDQSVTTNMWWSLAWNDPGLSWNSSEYDNITDVRIRTDKVWIPDIVAFNQESAKSVVQRDTLLVVDSSGNVLWVPPKIIKSTCKMDLTWFPFDSQSCDIKIGSWTYSGWKLDLQLRGDNLDVSGLISNPDWHLKGHKVKRHELIYDCCEEPYVDITVTVHVSRRISFYVYNIIIPIFIFGIVAILSLLLPAHSSSTARFLTIILSFLHLVMVSSMLATSDNTGKHNNSLINKIFASNGILLLLLLIQSIFVTNIANTSYSSLNICSRKILDVVVRIARKIWCFETNSAKERDDQLNCIRYARIIDNISIVLFLIGFIVRFLLLIYSAPTPSPDAW